MVHEASGETYTATGVHIYYTACALAAAQCIEIGPVCLWVGEVGVCGWVC